MYFLLFGGPYRLRTCDTRIMGVDEGFEPPLFSIGLGATLTQFHSVNLPQSVALPTELRGHMVRMKGLEPLTHAFGAKFQNRTEQLQTCI